MEQHQRQREVAGAPAQAAAVVVRDEHGAAGSPAQAAVVVPATVVVREPGADDGLSGEVVGEVLREVVAWES